MDSLIFELQLVFYFQLFLSANVRHKCTCEMDKGLKRGMCIKFESRKICIAGNQFDNSDLDIHNAEDKKLPD